MMNNILLFAIYMQYEWPKASQHHLFSETTDTSFLTDWGRDKMATIFADDILKCIFLNENVWIKINISLKFVPEGKINNILASAQIMACRLDQWWLVYWRIYASLGPNELKFWLFIQAQVQYKSIA